MLQEFRTTEFKNFDTKGIIISEILETEQLVSVNEHETGDNKYFVYSEHVAYDPNGEYVVVVATDGGVSNPRFLLFKQEKNSLSLESTLEGDPEAYPTILSVDFSFCGKFIVAAVYVVTPQTPSTTLILIENDNGDLYHKSVAALPKDTSFPFAKARFHPEDDYIVVAVKNEYYSDCLFIFSYNSEGELSEVESYKPTTNDGSQGIMGVDFNHNGNYIAAIYEEATAFDDSPCIEILSFDSEYEEVSQVGKYLLEDETYPGYIRFSPCGNFIVAQCVDATTLFSVDYGETEVTLSEIDTIESSYALPSFSPDGEFLFSGYNDEIALFEYDYSDIIEIATYPLYRESESAERYYGVFSPDKSNYLMVTHNDGGTTRLMYLLDYNTIIWEGKMYFELQEE